jgi:hypothetical protein
MSIEEGNEILAEFLGYTYIYHVSEDLSDCGGLYTNCKIYSKVPLRIKHGSIVCEDWRDFRHEFIVIQESGWPSDYPTELEFHKDWNKLMTVVDKIEGLDLKEWMYKWEEDNETQYNFQGISVEIERNSCWIYTELQLDPYYTFNENTYKKEWLSKIDATWNACVEFVQWYLERLKTENKK